MNQAEKEMLLNQIELKAGLVKKFHKEKSGASDLLEIYEDIKENGTSYTEAKLILEDLNLFLEAERGRM